jgi:toxin YhaV
LFLDQLEKLISSVDAQKTKHPDTYKTNQNTKLLAAIYKIAFEQIPADPASPRYRLGGTLGNDHKHWFREKFCNARFRLFFRFDQKSKIIVFAWVNDSTTLREYGAKTDAYAVFRKKLDDGNPATDWANLKASCLNESSQARMAAIFSSKPFSGPT